MLFVDLDGFTGSRIAAHAAVPLFDGERTEAPEFDPVAAGHGVDDFLEDGVHDPLDIALVQVWVFIRNFWINSERIIEPSLLGTP